MDCAGVPPGLENLEKVGNLILAFKAFKQSGIWLKLDEIYVWVWKSDSFGKKTKISCTWNKSLLCHFTLKNKMLLFSYHNISILPHNLGMELELGSGKILEKVLNVIKDNWKERIRK